MEAAQAPYPSPLQRKIALLAARSRQRSARDKGAESINQVLPTEGPRVKRVREIRSRVHHSKRVGLGKTKTPPFANRSRMLFSKTANSRKIVVTPV
jgi:hypothetical protein